EFEELREASKKRCADEEQYNLVIKAFEFANKAHWDVRRRSNEPYILHPIAVAKIVVNEIGLGCKSICAALLHDVVEDTEYTVEDIRMQFGDRIALLVDGLTKIKTALDQDSMKPQETFQAENHIRILLTLNDDARIILIKLADRLHNMRTLQFMPEYKREKILSETMYIFIPLAHRLGLFNIKTEMENIWLRFKEPEVYERISNRLEEIKEEKKDLIQRFIDPVSEIIATNGFLFKVSYRIKTPYSIWKKMEIKKIPFEEIFDLLAVRIIFKPKDTSSERQQCWEIFSLITEQFHYKFDRTRDWVTQPKVNGYEALHLTVMFEGSWIEVQIRSERMNDIAERGVAAHWAYKVNGGSVTDDEQDMDKWLAHISEILKNPDASALQRLDQIQSELYVNEISVFTPKGESLNLPKGSTALDFAYYIHSKIGNHAIAAKVNFKLVPLSQPLRNGDQVEIITSETAEPKREWLEFLKTNRAKNHLINALKEDSTNNIQEGYELLRKELEKRNIKIQRRVLFKLQDYYNAPSKDELYNRIGLRLIDLSDLDTALKTNRIQRNVQMWGFKLLTPAKAENKINVKEDYLLQEDVDNGKISFKTDTCCSPIPGDNVVGIVNEDNTVTIHKTSCAKFMAIAATKGNKIVAVKWSKHFMMSYLTRIEVSGIDRLGILSDLSHAITLGLGINIRKISIESHDEIFEGFIDLYVHNTNDLESLMDSIKNIKGVEKVNRVELNEQ
ncbi:MAG: bifunctional (p)ppGpp synthetase/guanosine-3',5'-bis(diphosphate) 3'-pyrophosphohydrolase, partial [Bacteroidales bacterium]|nr:bifunctional (p)ppGpp synthetase/guanosine-3',5'-bis(diphosphate) 3'-pyrophosphohydrolase [Bacteroidales bacterium]